ncbi:MAG: amino acid adenylation domain-containing protein [Dermatophilaceae bacterium]
MTLRELLDHWDDVGIRLWDDDGQLRYRAPRGIVTPDILAQLRARKDDILEQLRTRTGPQPRPDDRFEPFPLTDVQGAYLMGRSAVFEYGGVACHLYCEVSYPRLDPARTLAAWRVLVDRHDMLRVEVDASGFQRVRPQVPPLEIHTTILPSSAPEDRAAQVRRVRERLSHSVHPTGGWPMFAIELTQPPVDAIEAQSTMHISFDFLVGDWASLLRLIREWEQEYAGQAASPESSLQFRDYVVWELAQRDGHVHRQARDYWLRRIDTLPPAPQLPVRYEASDIAMTAAVRWLGHSYLLPRTQWQSLEHHAREHGLTASAAVLACYADVLSRWAEDPHFCLNLTVLDRPSEVPELAAVVGDFTSVILLETRADTRPFDGRARQMLEQLFTDLDHRSFSGVEVMRELARTRGRDAAVMPYVFTSAIGVGAGIRGATSTVHGSMDYTISQTPQAFLDCQVMDDVDGLHVHWDAREGIFPEGMLTDMFAAFTGSLQSLADDAGSWSASSPVLLPPEQRRERDQANATEHTLPSGMLHEFVLDAAHATPTAPAILGRDVTISYQDLLRRSATVATALEGAGVRRGDRVAVAIPKSPDQIAAVLGILITGAAYVPLDVRHPRARLAAICADATIAALVYTGEHRVTDDVPAIDMATLPPAASDDDLPRVAPDAHPNDLAYVIYTSGSTGQPKGVELSHRAVVNTVMDVNERFTLTSHDRTLAVADLGFDLSVYDIFGPLSVGAAVVVPPADTVIAPSTWLEVATEHGVTIMNTVPAVAQLLLTSMNNGALCPGSIRQWILSGDRVPPELVRDLHTAFPDTRFVAMGGATEAAIWSIAHAIMPDDLPRGSVPYGLPLANQQIAVIDRLGRDAPTGIPGEIVIMGAGLADGYSNAPELTRQRFVDDPERGRMYRTGDRGFYRPGGEVEILGRLDDQVKIRGHRIELGEIESVLADHETVAQAAVVAVGSEAQRRLHAFIVPAITEDDHLQQWAQDSAAEASVNVDISDRDGIAAHAAALEAACVATVMRTLEQIDAGLPVSPGNEWIVEAWRHALHDRDPVRHDDAELRRLWEHVSQLSPVGFDYQQFTDYVRRSAAQIAALLAGQTPAHELLFPDGSQAIAEHVYQDRASLRWGNAAVTALVSRIASRRDGSTACLRILEVGAGTGSTTGHVAAGLSDNDFRYTFTDRSAYFLPAARERWGDDDRWEFGTLDIDHDLAEQGFDHRSYDLVCAFGVLENAENIPLALERLARLTADGGLIMLSEPVGEQWWVYLSQIFLMTRPDCSRDGLGMFPSAQWWTLQLAASAGGGVAVLPAADGPLAPEQLAFFAARVRPAGALTPVEKLLPFLSSRLPEVMVPQQIDIATQMPLTRNGKIDKRTLVANATAAARDHPTGPSEPATVSADPKASMLPERAKTIAAHIAMLWAEQLGLGEPPDYGASPFDLGANSISSAAVAGRLRDSVSDLAEVSFETILRTLLGAPTIAAAATEFSRGAHADAVTPSAQPTVVIAPLREHTASPALPSRVTALFSDSLADGVSTVQLAAALPPGAGTIVAVTVPDDSWFTSQPADTVTDTIANSAAALLAALDADEYGLIGYSYGALAAMETARHLLEDGHDVLPLGLLDPHVVPVMADDQLSEIMFLTARGASPGALAADDDQGPTLVEILASVSDTQSGTLRDQRTQQVSDATAVVERFFARLASLDERSRWETYHAAVPADQQYASAEQLRREWLRYRHTMRAATLTPDPLVADAIIVQPRSSHGFLPGAHEHSAQTWRDVLIGTSAIAQVDGDHFTMLRSPHIAGTSAALIEGLTALGVYPPPVGP